MSITFRNSQGMTITLANVKNFYKWANNDLYIVLENGQLEFYADVISISASI